MTLGVFMYQRRNIHRFQYINFITSTCCFRKYFFKIADFCASNFLHLLASLFVRYIWCSDDFYFIHICNLKIYRASYVFYYKIYVVETHIFRKHLIIKYSAQRTNKYFCVINENLTKVWNTHVVYTFMYIIMGFTGL